MFSAAFLFVFVRAISFQDFQAISLNVCLYITLSVTVVYNSVSYCLVPLNMIFTLSSM